MPNSAKKASVIAALAAAKRGLRNRRTSSIGSGARRSQATNAASSDGGDGEARRGSCASVQPRVGASMMRPHERGQAGGGEREAGRGRAAARRGRGLRDEEAAGDAARRRRTGTLTRKIQLQSKCSISQPPATGPMRDAEAGRRRPRCRSPCRARRRGKTLVRIDSVDGMMNAPPTPISARVAISISAEPASAERASRGRRRAARGSSARLRPKRSPSAPAVSSRPAKTSM